jgi:hypothetical protein
MRAAPAVGAQWALELQSTLDELFWDEAGGAYFNSEAGDPSILLRMKEDYDGAEPAASSIAAANLWRLAGLSGTEVGSAARVCVCEGRLGKGACRWGACADTGGSPAYWPAPAVSARRRCLGAQESQRLRERAARCAAAFGDRLEQAPIAMPQMAASLHLLMLAHPRQVGGRWLAAAAGLASCCCAWWREGAAACEEARALPAHTAGGARVALQSTRLHQCRSASPLQVIVAGSRGAADTEALLDAVFASFTPGEPLLRP